MVSNLAQHAPILERGVHILESIMHLYAEDQHVHPYFVSALNDAADYRNSLLERLANPTYFRNTFEGNFIVSLGHFLDSHWGDYLPESPKPDIAKRHKIEKLQSDMESVISEIAVVSNLLLKQ